MMKFALLASAALLKTTAALAQTTCTMPPEVTAAGYTTPTFRGVSLDQWKPGSGGSSMAQCGVSKGQTGINIAGGGCNGYNEQMTSLMRFGGGGYFEATFSFPNNPQGGNGWASFWGNTADDGQAVNIEVDYVEVQGQTLTHGTIHWGSGPSFGTASNTPQRFPPGTDFSEPHRYGMLWIPGKSLVFFFDGKVLPNPTPLGSGSPYAVLDQQHLDLKLGTGSTNPMTVHDVGVWQKDGSKNIGSTGTPVNALTACRPTVYSNANLQGMPSDPASIPDVTTATNDPAPTSPADVPTSKLTAADNAALQEFEANPSKATLKTLKHQLAINDWNAQPTMSTVTMQPVSNTASITVQSSRQKKQTTSPDTDPFATVVAPVATNAEITAQPTGDGSFLSLSGANSVSTLLPIMAQNASIARPESGGTMAITLAPGDITPGTGATATDAAGNVFSLPYKGGMWGSSMGQPTENGQPISDGTGWVGAIRVVDGTACFENAKGLGWGCQGSGTWVADPGPADSGSSTGGLH